jgi:hypothetical protein
MQLNLSIIFLLILTNVNSFSFLSLGDWGCHEIGGYHERDQYIVEKELTKRAQIMSPKFVLNTGDNFYYCGINDTSLFNTTFENIYKDNSLMIPWYGCLGNHDYGYEGSVEAQINYKSPNNNRWLIYDRYYYKRLIYNNVNISLVVLDSSPCQSPYTSSNPKGWDPCGSVIPGCPDCKFHQNVIKQSCKKQYEWFENVIKTIPSNDWKILMIHAPALDVDNMDFIPLIQDTNFHLYINGHVHTLAHYKIDNIGNYITSGAGCMVKIHRHYNYTTDNTESSCTNYNKNHTCQIIYQKKIAGFTEHTFINNYSTLVNKFYSYDGKLIYNFNINK